MLSAIKNFIEDSFIVKALIENIDSISYIVLLSILFCSLFFNSEILGGIALIFSFLVIFKLLFNGKKLNYNLENYERALIIYFLIVTVSLFASTLFKLSLHGYIKTLIYILFYFSAGVFFKYNKKKILPTFILIALFATFESVIAILQNSAGVLEISGWQDTTNLNPEEIVSRAYGTLKPYNPNLLAGYLLATLSSFIYLALTAFKNGKKKTIVTMLLAFFINLVAIIDTGCRGAYLGFLFFFPLLFLAFIYFLKIKNIKKIITGAVVALVAFIALNPALIKRVQSIFALRADSSISFRLNVYESALRMFLDNPIFGIGVGNQNFREIYGLYMKTGFDALGAYCVPLEIALESGIFALIAFIVFLVLIFKKAIFIFRGDDRNAKILALSVVLMIAATMGHGLFDTIWFRPQLQFMFWTMIAMLKVF